MAYAKGKLILQEKNALIAIDDSSVYTCECTLLYLCQTLNLWWYDESITMLSWLITLLSAITVVVNYPPVCYYSGSSEKTIVNDKEMTELKQQYAVVRPTCSFT